MPLLPYTIKILGTLLMFFSLAQIIPGFLAYFYGEQEYIYNFIYTGFITFFIGFIMYFLSKKKNGDLRTKDGFIITVFFWTVLGIFGSIPFYLANLEDVNYIDALFESISGLTTTGATVFVGLDEMAKKNPSLRGDYSKTQQMQAKFGRKKKPTSFNDLIGN